MLQAGDRVLVAEACNHNRITDVCNDIGMVQVRVWGCGAGKLINPAASAPVTDRQAHRQGKALQSPQTLSMFPRHPSPCPCPCCCPRCCCPQIPGKIAEQGGRGVVVEHAFGREFPELLEAQGALPWQAWPCPALPPARLPARLPACLRCCCRLPALLLRTICLPAAAACLHCRGRRRAGRLCAGRALRRLHDRPAEDAGTHSGPAGGWAGL